MAPVDADWSRVLLGRPPVAPVDAVIQAGGVPADVSLAASRRRAAASTQRVREFPSLKWRLVVKKLDGFCQEICNVPDKDLGFCGVIIG